jgi:hypothetical protein
MGALGTSSDIGVDLGKQWRVATSAPPAEMLIAVANSSKSLLFSSRVRRKTGIAKRNLAHFRIFLRIGRPFTCVTRPKTVLTTIKAAP